MKVVIPGGTGQVGAILNRALSAAGLPATKWIAELGAFVIRSDTEFLVKSRRVIPGRLLAAGFGFRYGTWAQAAHELVRRARDRREQ